MTPPIAATSLISSSPVAEYDEEEPLDFLSGYFVGAELLPGNDAEDSDADRDGVDNLDDVVRADGGVGCNDEKLTDNFDVCPYG